MNIIVFGTGRAYENRKARLQDTVNIVAFLDNDSEKQGKNLDGVTIHAPEMVNEIPYDMIAIMAKQYDEIKEQLLGLGVSADKIFSDDIMYKLYKQKDASIHGKFPDGKKKMLVFSHAFTFSGAQNAMWLTMNILKQHGYSFIVVAKYDGELREKMDRQGICTVLTDDFRKENELILQMLEWADIVFINTLWLQYLVEDMASFGKPVFWWLHESGAINRVGVEGFKKIQKISQVHIYAVSRVVIDYVEEKAGINSNVEILCFGIPDYETRKCEKQKNITFLHIGPFVDLKAHDVLLKAIDMLPEAYKDKSEFLLVGDKKPDDLVQGLIQKNPNVKVIGKVNNERIPEIYAKCDAVICSSREESMSIAVVEGFLNGKPAIVSSVTGITEYMENGKEGYIFPTEDVTALRDCIMNMMDQESEIGTMGIHARQNYERNFSMKRFEDRLLTIMNKLTENT